MFIKQIIEFLLTRPGPYGRTCSPIAGYFHDETKIVKDNLRVDYYLLLKYCRMQCTLLLSTWAEPLTKFNTKMQNFNQNIALRFGLKAKINGGSQQFHFFDWLSNKNL